MASASSHHVPRERGLPWSLGVETQSNIVSLPATELHHRGPTSGGNGSLPLSYTSHVLPVASPSFTSSTMKSPTRQSQFHKQDPPNPKIYDIPLKYFSLITLALQNASLTIILHYSRVFSPPDKMYSGATAVLLNELLKGSISMAIALSRIDGHATANADSEPVTTSQRTITRKSVLTRAKNMLMNVSKPNVEDVRRRFRTLVKEVFSPDCWKLSIPAILYVVQNNLQFVAASNLDPAAFQVTYQMKILTTAAFSVLLLRKRISTRKWISLLFLAMGVGIVQMQSGSKSVSGSSIVRSPPTLPNSTIFINVDPGQTIEPVTVHTTEKLLTHEMNRFKGFLAVSFACITSGLAGVYFEMVLKGSRSDLWVRNLQLSLFSLIPALVPIIYNSSPNAGIRFPLNLFHHFGFWAWTTVLVQVAGGLITAVVIKYSDNILKGFATSLSIVISSLASVALFGDQITLTFTIGATTVLAATAMYNQPETPVSELLKEQDSYGGGNKSGFVGPGLVTNNKGFSPVDRNVSMLGSWQQETRNDSLWTDASPAFGLSTSSAHSSPVSLHVMSPMMLSPQMSVVSSPNQLSSPSIISSTRPDATPHPAGISVAASGRGNSHSSYSPDLQRIGLPGTKKHAGWDRD
ncbi:nucleotide-sugar transporter-domain-containing protein [Cantharellus anzutake]|uniref:nucleotide-sugar transporter-domain-containing protein n=1 Tax=Cantharellus anzutake TaxID=1750568 RepID=UPI0019084E45|nr:nucleotide-sugar transporter-domain-containing protein [Cantharellus anzutake]KAF8343884.1 nucleotide-sugar transporter-domain-containing protein [Cantharellus anzutake]